MANDGEGTDTWLARRERVKQTANNGNGMGMPLAIAVQLLPTPTTEPATGNGHARNLGKEVQLLPTPTSADAKASGAAGYGGNEFCTLTDATARQPERFGQYAPAIARQEQAFGYPAPSPTEPGKNGKPRLSARFAEWMMGAPPGWITDTPGVTRNEALRMAGNGVVRQQAVAALLDMRAAIRQEQAT